MKRGIVCLLGLIWTGIEFQNLQAYSATGLKIPFTNK